jgi:hypothetical protein
MRTLSLKLGLVVAAMLLVTGSALAHQANTQSTIAFSPASPVTAGTQVTITGTVTYTGTYGGGPSNGHSVTAGAPVVGESLQIQRALDAFGVHTSCANAASFATISQGNTNSSGQFSIVFDTTGLGGQTLGFRSHHPAGTGAGPGHGSGQSASACADLVILEESEGCSHGFWKTHDGSGPQDNEWPEDYEPTDTLGSVFDFSSISSGLITQYESDSLATALAYTGGSGLDGGARILLRNAVASLLNAAHDGVAYPMSVEDVVEAVNEALASEDRDTMLALEAELDELNNLGCPLDDEE